MDLIKLGFGFAESVQKVYPYTIDDGALFLGNTDWFERTPVAGDQTKWAFSSWYKLCDSTNKNLLTADTTGTGDTHRADITLDGNSRINVISNNGTSVNVVFDAQIVDFTGWSHIYVEFDTSQAVDSDRVRAWWNGVELAKFGAPVYPSLNYSDFAINSAITHYWLRGIGGDAYAAQGQFFDGVIPGIGAVAQISPLVSSLWVPKKYTSGYGTNGFRLDFDNGAALGTDTSGNGNDWTVTGTPTQTLDTPTNNHCTLNPLDPRATGTLSKGNLTMTGAGVSSFYTTVGVSSGRFCATFDGVVDNGVPRVGAAKASTGIVPGGRLGDFGGQIAYGSANGYKFVDGVQTPYGDTWGTSDSIDVCIDFDAQTLAFYKNGVSQGDIDISTWLDGELVLFSACEADSTGTSIMHYNNASSPPEGFSPLCAANLPEPEILDPATGNDVVLYQGTGAALDIGGVLFQPDYTNLKRRNTTGSWHIFDALRGPEKMLRGESTAAETDYLDSLISFNADGFSLGANSGTNSNHAFLAHCLRRGPEYGFDIVVADPFNNNSTMPHNCGGPPEFIIAKLLNGSSDWYCWHDAIPNKNLRLNLPNAAGNGPIAANPTVDTFTATNLAAWSGYRVVFYLFRSVPGFSKVFRYESNNSADGPFVNLGFKPKAILGKDSQASENWFFIDSERDPHNKVTKVLYPDLSSAEAPAATLVNFCSSGFKPTTTGITNNVAGNTVVGIAWAEQPFKYSNAF